MLCLCLSLSLMGRPAQAGYVPGDPVYVFASSDLRFDDNVLLLAPGKAVPVQDGNNSKSDWINVDSIGMHASENWSQQSFNFDGLFAKNFYANDHHFNYTNWQNQLGWNAALGTHLAGSLSLADSNQLAGAGTVVGSQDDITRARVANGALVWSPNSWGALDGAASRTIERHSQLDTYDYNQNNFIAGGTLSSNGGSSLGLHAENRQVSYLQDLSSLGYSDAYTLHYTRLDAVWPLSGKLTFSGRLGRASLGVSGRKSPAHTIGKTDLIWTVTGKTKVDVGYAEDYDPPGRSLVPITYQARYLNLSSQLSGKTSLQVQFRSETRDYFYEAVGRESTNTLRVSLIWLPLPALQVSPYVLHVLRGSQATYDEYSDNQIGATLKAYF